MILKKALTVIRIALGTLMIISAIPPLSVAMCNAFVLMPPAAGIVLVFLPGLLKLLKRLFGRYYMIFTHIAAAVVTVFVVLFAAEFCVIYMNSGAQTPPDSCTVILLGAKVGTIDINGRIDAAGKFLQLHPDVCCIAAGGQGADENVSEAQYMQNKLVSQYGISSGRIFLDSKSQNTIQNIKNAVFIMNANGLPRSAVIVTDRCHMFRAKLIASRCSLETYSCPARTDVRIVVPLYLRELFALPKSLLFDRP